MDEGFPADPKAADEWPSTKSLPSGGLAELKQSDQPLPTELRGTERMAIGNEKETKPNCRGQGYTQDQLVGREAALALPWLSSRPRAGLATSPYVDRMRRL